MEIKDQVKRSVSIVDVVSLYVNLKPVGAGKYYRALCPFHTEKDPSFYVMPEKETYTCYGCNKFGDIFTMVQEMENLNFPEAINFLIDTFNIPIEKNTARPQIKKDDYLRINEIALKYFVDNLFDTAEGRLAGEYLKKRGITGETVDLFVLGYAENKWDGLYNHLKTKSCDIKKALELGLLIQSSKNHIYDRFRGRVIFPIFSESGKIIAFGGRTVVDDSSKYLNSPDTPLYKKGKNLYGFNLAKKFIRENNYGVMVEGYFDMISLFQNGVQNTVASLGTALTEHQINLLKRFSDHTYMFYDSDRAGIAATVRGIEKMFEQNVNPRIIHCPDAKDPDDFIREKGVPEFRKLLEGSSTGFDFLLRRIEQGYHWRSVPEKKRDAIEYLKNFLEKFADPIVKAGYIRMAADYFQEEDIVFRGEKKRNYASPGQQSRLVITPAEKDFIESILAMPPLIAEVKDLFNEDILSVLASRNIIKALLRNYSDGTGEIENYRDIFEGLSDAEQRELRMMYTSKDRLEPDRSKLCRRIENSFVNFQHLLNKKQISEINRQLRIAEKEDNFPEIEKLMNLKNQFIQAAYKHKRAQEE